MQKQMQQLSTAPHSSSDICNPKAQAGNHKQALPYAAHRLALQILIGEVALRDQDESVTGQCTRCTQPSKARKQARHADKQGTQPGQGTAQQLRLYNTQQRSNAAQAIYRAATEQPRLHTGKQAEVAMRL